jgi:hypothetical protein
LLWLLVAAATVRDIVRGGKIVFKAPPSPGVVDEKPVEKREASADKHV